MKARSGLMSCGGSEASHRSALSLRQMREAASAALPMIAGVGEGIDVSDK